MAGDSDSLATVAVRNARPKFLMSGEVTIGNKLIRQGPGSALDRQPPGPA
ncbi:hypothetical protein ACOJVU_16645 [Mycobacterium sp. THU-M104]